MNPLIIATLIFGLFHFSEGKPCPEETRPHTSRCDSYFRCVVLPSKSHVWVPTTCERGLIYEVNLRLCVLPDDDWECTLGDAAPAKKDENNIYGINSLRIFAKPEKLEETNDEQKVNLLEDSKVSDNSEEGDYLEVNGVVAGGKNSSDLAASDKLIEDDNFESSGDGEVEDAADTNTIKEPLELKDGGLEISESESNVDPKLAAHLQRLSQLIDGLKHKYQDKPNDNTELRPDQLNAFLAHYNIRSQFDAINPSVFDRRPIPQNGQIEPHILQQIIRKQQKLQNLGQNSNMSSVTPSPTGNYVQVETVSKQTPNYNNNKILLHNYIPEKNYHRPNEYTNSQIVVNKPEGSVVFSLPQNNKYQPRPKPEDDDEPRISEETLKTVLELSKQMISNQNIRQVFPNNGLYQPLLQPMYVPVPLINPHHSNSYPTKYFPQSGYGDEDKYEKIPLISYPKPDHKRKPSVSIVQNSVLPFTVSAGSESGIRPQPSGGSSSFYGSQTSDKVDSYGNKVSSGYEEQDDTDRVDFPPYQNENKLMLQNSLYSTTLHPPLSYTSEPQTSALHLGSSNVNAAYNTRLPQSSSSQSFPYPSDPNINQDIPKPILQQPAVQILSHQPLYNRPLSSNPMNAAALQPSGQSPYTSLNSFPMVAPQLRPINPSSVNIRPNSIQASASGTSMGTSDYGSQILADSPESHLSYNQNNVNNQIVSDLLASNLDQSNAADNTHLVNLGGNFINYEVYKNQILPALGASATAAASHKVEIITCAAGVRQPNTTDCTKYYVCSKKDGKVLSYSCPPYTGFNAQTHICDARTYAFCNPQAIYSRFTVSENRKLQMDAIQALEEAKKVRDEAIQAQNLANLIRFETQKAINNTLIPQSPGLQEPTILTSYLQGLQKQTAPSMESSIAAMALAQTTANPLQTASTISSAGHRRRRYHCTDGAKIPDPQSVLKYYVCFKTGEGKMKRRKMTCTAGLMFCAKTLLCTLPRKCNS